MCAIIKEMKSRVGCLIAVTTAVVATGCGGATKPSAQAAKPAFTDTSPHALKTHAGTAPGGTVRRRAPGITAGAPHRKPSSALIAGRWNGIKPAEIDFSADSSNIVAGIHWSSWTSAHAVGEGKSIIESCVPDCASGAVKVVRATIALSRPIAGHFTKVNEVRVGQSMTASYRSDRWPLGAR